jgi:hypothetical protein
VSRRAKPPTGSRAPVARYSQSGYLPAGEPAPLHWFVQTYTSSDVAESPALCRWYASRAEARAAAQKLGGQRKAGRPRRAGAQPITRVDVLLGASELEEIDSARAGVARQRWIRDAALEKARRGR